MKSGRYVPQPREFVMNDSIARFLSALLLILSVVLLVFITAAASAGAIREQEIVRTLYVAAWAFALISTAMTVLSFKKYYQIRR